MPKYSFCKLMVLKWRTLFSYKTHLWTNITSFSKPCSCGPYGWRLPACDLYITAEQILKGSLVPFISPWAGEKGESRKKEGWSSKPLRFSKERTLPFSRDWKRSTRECNYNKLRSITHDPVPEKYSLWFLCWSAGLPVMLKNTNPYLTIKTFSCISLSTPY